MLASPARVVAISCKAGYHRTSAFVCLLSAILNVPWHGFDCHQVCIGSHSCFFHFIGVSFLGIGLVTVIIVAVHWMLVSCDWDLLRSWEWRPAPASFPSPGSIRGGKMSSTSTGGCRSLILTRGVSIDND